MQGLLKFITCGSVDDGKSTLIGHILYDSKLLYADQEKALELDSKVGSRGGAIDYSLLLDGLMAEREQGITIDVAYRYFTTDNRSFIVADTPGHEEYTRNMAVGASFADLAVILIDAKQGVLVQTKRHARICSLMGIKYFVFAVNKMDLVDYSQERFVEIEGQIAQLTTELGLENVVTIPVSATEGDNVTKRSDNIPWYQGEVLLDYLEKVDIAESQTEQGFYMPVQRVCRPNHSFRGFQGQIEAGELHKGDEITTLPSNEQAHVKSIHVADKEVESAGIGQPVTVQLDREVDVSRGCVLTKDSNLKTAAGVNATLLWMDDVALTQGKNFFVKLGTKMIPGIVTKIVYTIDVNTGEKKRAEKLSKNEIAVCQLGFADQIVAAEFDEHKTMGELILIDRVSNMTSACGVVNEIHAEEEGLQSGKVNRYSRSALKGQKAITVEFPINRAGITTDLVEDVEKALSIEGRHTYLYRVKAGDPVADIIKHLHRAGIIVLLAVDTDVTDTSSLQMDESYYADLEKRTDLTAQSVAGYIKEISMYSSGISEHGDYI
jgi:sulfate adenylyltransferase subunit 1